MDDDIKFWKKKAVDLFKPESLDKKVLDRTKAKIMKKSSWSI